MTGAAHPDVVPYAQDDSLTNEQRAVIMEHLKGCEECRDLVLFIRKTNATLRYEGRVSRVAKALRMSTEAIEREVQAGTSLAALLKGPPAAPVTETPSPVRPISPVKK
jgi:Putative zinc-finger